ncbi:MAG: hypothetical protein P8144_04670 [Gammaproteobacteria bacterium]
MEIFNSISRCFGLPVRNRTAAPSGVLEQLASRTDSSFPSRIGCFASFRDPVNNSVSSKLSRVKSKINATLALRKAIKRWRSHRDIDVRLLGKMHSHSKEKLKFARAILESPEHVEQFLKKMDTFGVNTLKFKHRLLLSEAMAKQSRNDLQVYFNCFDVSSLDSVQQLNFLDLLLGRMSGKSESDDLTLLSNLGKISFKINEMDPERQLNYLKNMINLLQKPQNEFYYEKIILKRKIDEINISALSVDQQYRFASCFIEQCPLLFDHVIEKINFECMSQKQRMELANQCAAQSPKLFHKFFKKFNLPSEYQLPFLDQATAVGAVSHDFDVTQFDLSKLSLEQRQNIAHRLFEQDEYAFARNIRHFALSESKINEYFDRLHAKGCLDALSNNLENFGVSPEKRLEFADTLRHSSPRLYMKHIDKFQLKLSERFEFAQQCLDNKLHALLVQNIQLFDLPSDNMDTLVQQIYHRCDPSVFLCNTEIFLPYLKEDQKNELASEWVKSREELSDAEVQSVVKLNLLEPHRIDIVEKMAIKSLPNMASQVENFNLTDDQWVAILSKKLELEERQLHIADIFEFVDQLEKRSKLDDSLAHLTQLGNKILSTVFASYMPKTMHAETMRAAVRVSSVESSAPSDYPIQQKFESFFKRLDLKNEESPYYIDPILLTSRGESNRDELPSPPQIKKNYFERLRAITSDESLHDEKNVYFVNSTHRASVQKALAEVGVKLEQLAESDPTAFCAQMGGLISGFQECETGQVKAIDAIYQNIVCEQLPANASFEERIKQAVVDAKMRAFFDSTRIYNGGVHELALSKHAVDLAVSLPGSVAGFQDRAFILSADENAAIVEKYFDVFTKDFLVKCVMNQVETAEDRADVLRNLGTRPRKKYAESQSQERPIKGVEFLQWINTVCQKNGLDFEATLNHLQLNCGEYFDQPYRIGEAAIEQVLIELKYLRGPSLCEQLPGSEQLSGQMSEH